MHANCKHAHGLPPEPCCNDPQSHRRAVTTRFCDVASVTTRTSHTGWPDPGAPAPVCVDWEVWGFCGGSRHASHAAHTCLGYMAHTQTHSSWLPGPNSGTHARLRSIILSRSHVGCDTRIPGPEHECLLDPYLTESGWPKWCSVTHLFCHTPLFCHPRAHSSGFLF